MVPFGPHEAPPLKAARAICQGISSEGVVYFLLYATEIVEEFAKQWILEQLGAGGC